MLVIGGRRASQGELAYRMGGRAGISHPLASDVQRAETLGLIRDRSRAMSRRAPHGGCSRLTYAQR